MERPPTWEVTEFQGWVLTPNDGRQMIMNLPDGSISIGCIRLGGYGSRVSVSVRPEDLDELISALMEAKRRTAICVLWSEAVAGYLRVEPGEYNAPVWDSDRSRALQYANEATALAARDRLFDAIDAETIKAIRYAAR